MTKRPRLSPPAAPLAPSFWSSNCPSGDLEIDQGHKKKQQRETWLSAASQCETQGAMGLEQLQVVERLQASRPLLKVATSQRHWTATWVHLGGFD